MGRSGQPYPVDGAKAYDGLKIPIAFREVGEVGAHISGWLGDAVRWESDSDRVPRGWRGWDSHIRLTAPSPTKEDEFE